MKYNYFITLLYAPYKNATCCNINIFSICEDIGVRKIYCPKSKSLCILHWHNTIESWMNDVDLMIKTHIGKQNRLKVNVGWLLLQTLQGLMLEQVISYE